MSGLTANTHSNIKQVMRTALVGVSPADQLMLKGYLRVLLRLEADLEWVPANHPQVDLLFINEEFRSSESVQRLLSSSPGKPMLFVRRSQNDQGRLEGDTLIIPLKELPALNQWLVKHIPILQSKDNQGAKSVTQIRQSLNPDPINSINTANKTAQANANNPKSEVSSSTQSSTKLSAQLKGLMDFAKLVSERPAGMHELLVNNIRIGLVDLKRQRLWLDRDNVHFDKSWQLAPVNEPTPNSESVDFFQWIWSKVWAEPKEALPLVSNDYTYQLRYWPKPTDKINRTELLRVFTALESNPQHIGDIARLANTSTTITQKVIAGLLLSGGMQKATYKQLSLSKAQAKDTQAISAKSEHAKAVEPPVVSTGSALDDALQRRKSGQSAPLSSSIDLNTAVDTSRQTSNPPQPVAEPSEKKGFLSRLRKKLGL